MTNRNGEARDGQECPWPRRRKKAPIFRLGLSEFKMLNPPFLSLLPIRAVGASGQETPAFRPIDGLPEGSLR